MITDCNLINLTKLCLNVDVKVTLDYPDWGGTKAPNLDKNKDIDFWMIFIGYNNIYLSKYKYYIDINSQ